MEEGETGQRSGADGRGESQTGGVHWVHGLLDGFGVMVELEKSGDAKWVWHSAGDPSEQTGWHPYAAQGCRHSRGAWKARGVIVFVGPVPDKTTLPSHILEGMRACIYRWDYHHGGRSLVTFSEWFERFGSERAKPIYTYPRDGPIEQEDLPARAGRFVLVPQTACGNSMGSEVVFSRRGSGNCSRAACQSYLATSRFRLRKGSLVTMPATSALKRLSDFGSSPAMAVTAHLSKYSSPRPSA